MDWTLLVATTPGLSGPRNNGSEEVLRIPQSSSIIEASQLDCLISYQDTYPSAEMQSVYSTVPTDRALTSLRFINNYIRIENFHSFGGFREKIKLQPSEYVSIFSELNAFKI